MNCIFSPTSVLMLAGLALGWSAVGCVCTCPLPAAQAGGTPPPPDSAEQRSEGRPGQTAQNHSGPQPSESVAQEFIEDEVDGAENAASFSEQAVAHPLLDVSDDELFRRLGSDISSLGSMSLGLPNRGSLINPSPLPEDPRWIAVDPAHAYGTKETIDNLSDALTQVHAEFPDTPPLHIGHISGPKGGFLRPHRSHQSGRDVDLGYYYNGGGHWYMPADATSLDVARTWTLVRALITETDVRFILMDRSIQPLLRKHAESAGEDKAWLDDIFLGRGGRRQALIRHVPGHRTHMHVRFYNPIAQETARRCYPGLVKLKLIKPPVHFLRHKVKKGDTLISLAKRYGTTVKAIKRANRLRSNKIIARKSYKIPRTGPASASGPLSIPSRRLPPTPKPLPGSSL